MLSINEFLKQYEAYSDEELFKMSITIGDYTQEAQDAFNIAINKRGGIEEVKNRLRQKQSIVNEENRILSETSKLYSIDSNPEFLNKMITSDILSKERVQELVQIGIKNSIVKQEDEKIKPKTIFGSLIGGIIASLIGGFLWGLQLIQMHRMFIIFGFGLVILCYGIIKGFTKQTKANKVVLITTIIAVVASLLIGQLLFESFG